MIPKDREVLKGSGGSENRRGVLKIGLGNGLRAMIVPRKATKSRTRAGARNRTGSSGDFRIASKMQARSVDPAAGTDRKISRRCRRVKGRIEKQASTGTEKRTRTRASIRSRIKPAAGSKGLTSRPFRMPCSGRACRSENELIDGSLGTILLCAELRFPLTAAADRICLLPLHFSTRLASDASAVFSTNTVPCTARKLAKLQRQAAHRYGRGAQIAENTGPRGG